MNKSFFNQNVSDSIIGTYILSCLIIIGLYLLLGIPMLLLGGAFLIAPLVCLGICFWVFIAFLLQSHLEISLTYSLGWVSVIILFAAPPLIYKYIMYQIDGGTGLAAASLFFGVMLHTLAWLGAVIGAWIVVSRTKKSPNVT